MKHIFLFLLLVLVPSLAAADCLFCGQNLACKGDSVVRLFSKCGDPVVTYQTQVCYGSRYGDCAIVWTGAYNFGPNKFVYEVEAIGGRIITVRALTNARGWND